MGSQNSAIQVKCVVGNSAGQAQLTEVYSMVHWPVAGSAGRLECMSSDFSSAGRRNQAVPGGVRQAEPKQPVSFPPLGMPG